MDSVIYYFSGTGNSYKIAKNIGEKLGDTQLIKISLENMHLALENNYKKVGIVFPVYFFSIPKMVKEFVEDLKMDKDSYIYAVGTCGGFVGVSFVDLNKIFIKKGYSKLSTFKVLMPDNYQVLYAPSPIEKQLEIIHKSNIVVGKMIPIIKEERSHNEKEPNILSKIVGHTAYSTFNPKYKDQNFWADDNCNGCTICEKVCPANDIVMEGDRPKWLNNCEQCLSCMQWCPEKAIQYKKSTIKRERYTHPEVKVGEMIEELSFRKV